VKEPIEHQGKIKIKDQNNNQKKNSKNVRTILVLELKDFKNQNKRL
jgi:hypothetical protein